MRLRTFLLLLRNHPHDSICACSIDQVHKDMIHRFDQIKELCKEIVSYFIDRDMDRIAQGKMPEMIDEAGIGERVQENSILKLSGKGIALSTVKVPENEKQNAVIVRMINLSDRDSTASIEFSRAI